MTLDGLEPPTLCLEGRCSNPAELQRRGKIIYHIYYFVSTGEDSISFTVLQPSIAHFTRAGMWEMS